MAFVTTKTKQLSVAIKTNNDVPADVEILGIVTIEDILEKLLKADINDERDYDETVVSRSMRLARMAFRPLTVKHHYVPKFEEDNPMVITEVEETKEV